MVQFNINRENYLLILVFSWTLMTYLLRRKRLVDLLENSPQQLLCTLEVHHQVFRQDSLLFEKILALQLTSWVV